MTKKDPKNSTINERPNGLRPKKSPEIIDLQGLFQKKRISRKNRKTCDFQGLLSQKNKNSILRFSTSNPVSRRPQKLRTTCPHGPRTTLLERFSGFRSPFFNLFPRKGLSPRSVHHTPPTHEIA